MPSLYTQTLQYLYGLERLGIRMGLERIRTILRVLDNPQNGFPIIHIGGTNGKGSTAAILSSILAKAGYKVGLYTSPHLERFTERIKVNDREIPRKRVVELVERVIERGQGVKGSRGRVNTLEPSNPRTLEPSFFEFVTAMAFLYFSEEGIDIAVVEVGLGGRLDATNVGKPISSIITNVTKEHEDILGKGLASIAREKAGIIRRGGVLITTEKKTRVVKILEEICQEKRATLYRLGKEFWIESAKGGFSFYGRRWEIKGLETNLLGSHQWVNVAAALAALEVVSERGYPVTEETIRKGLKGVHWPGRLEVVSRNPLIVLDCAHNPGGARVLRETLLDLGIRNYDLRFKISNSKSQIDGRKSKITNHKSQKRLFLILGMMADKDIKGFASILAPLAYRVILTVPRTPRAAPLRHLLQKVGPYAKRVEAIDEVGRACRFAIKNARMDDLICVTGSIFTVGEGRGFLLQNYTALT